MRLASAEWLPFADAEFGAGLAQLVIDEVDDTQIYFHAHLELKERALARTAPPDSPPGRYRPPDSLLAFLEGL